MNKSTLRRLAKIEDRIKQIVHEELGLDTFPIEFDIVPTQKMFEILAYNIPTNISNWKRGRDYERTRTIYEKADPNLPYEVVINSNPARAYFMNSNTFAVQVLVMAHVYGHCAFFTNNKYFRKSRQDIIEIMHAASERVNKYERKYGIDEVESTVDAGHALQLHSSPFASEETENEKRRRIFEQEKAKIYAGERTAYSDLLGGPKVKVDEDVELYNQKLWKLLRLTTPVEPTDDILRYIIDNSRILEDWQNDILEILRIEGQYYWPMMKTKYMNEGFATLVHEKVMTKLFREGKLTAGEHAQFNYSNSLVKAENPFQLNPYLMGCSMWKNIEERWNTGRHGREWADCIDVKQKEEWDTDDMEGWEKCKSVMTTYTDWFFVQNFLTPDLIRDMKIYLYKPQVKSKSIDYIVTKAEAEEIREKIVAAFAASPVPKIKIVNGNYDDKGWMALEHRWAGSDLDITYANETLKHIVRLWGQPARLTTKEGDEDKVITVQDDD